MEKRIANLYITANSLGIDMNGSAAACRHVLHSAIYLSQSLGLPTHYQFRMTLDGPRSMYLNRDFAEYQETSPQVHQKTKTLRYRPEYQRITDQVTNFRNVDKPAGTTAYDWMTTAASIHFLSTTNHTSPEDAIRFIPELLMTAEQIHQHLIPQMHEHGILTSSP